MNSDFFLTIEAGHPVIQYDGTHGGRITRRLRSLDDFQQFLRSKANEAGRSVEDLLILCSSSMDFPEEYTDDPEVVKLCCEIRG